MLQRNYEIIPKRMYFSDKSFVKVELGVGKQKSLNDKRDDIMKREGIASAAAVFVGIHDVSMLSIGEREVRRVMKGGYD